jgi:hypothetical protein
MDSRQRLMEVRRRWWIIHGDGRATAAVWVATFGLRGSSGISRLAMN